jgi:hypothetical protein
MHNSEIIHNINTEKENINKNIENDNNFIDTNMIYQDMDMENIVVIDCPCISKMPFQLPEYILSNLNIRTIIFADVCKYNSSMPLSSFAMELQNRGIFEERKISWKVNICVYICVYLYVYICIYVCVHIYTFIYLSVYNHLCIMKTYLHEHILSYLGYW